MKLFPGQVWRTYFDPVDGHEQGEARPAVILSSATHLRMAADRLAVVIPLTTRERPGWSYRIPVTSGPRHGWAVTEQLRTIVTTRFVTDAPWWQVTDDELAAIRHAVGRMLIPGYTP